MEFGFNRAMNNSISSLKLVKVSEKNYEFIRNLRNMPEIKSNFVIKTYITKDAQKEYMDKHKDNYFVCVSGVTELGYIGVIENDIRIAVLPNFHSQGIGTFMINEIKQLYPNAQAKIAINNEKSIKLFKKNNFKLKYYLFECD
jgi:ribosomal protein S18 acetylase RimI-like enzyme